jgi:poly(A) RNA polymerase GLD2
MQLRDMLYYSVSSIFPRCGLYIVGSSLNGFGNSKSDMDLCLMITHLDLDQKTDAVIVLTTLMRALKGVDFISKLQMILAKVPILRMEFHQPYEDIVVDLNANNTVAIKNTHLLCYYSSFDWRVRPLVSVVKEWAKRRGINDANRSSFTSYSLVLMVIHFLQCGPHPPVLPSLQQLYKARFDKNADVRHLNVSVPLDPSPTQIWEFRNKESLGALLLNFLEYFAKQFDFDQDAVSVRIGRKTGRATVARNRSPFNHLSQWRCICIEEPFTLSNTAHSVYDERVFLEIKQAFSEGYEELNRNRDLNALLEAATASRSSPVLSDFNRPLV